MLGWEPKISLEEGFAETYKWTISKMKEQLEGNSQQSLLKVWAKSEVLSDDVEMIERQVAYSKPQ